MRSLGGGWLCGRGSSGGREGLEVDLQLRN